MGTQPTVGIISGPNGAGKSTNAPSLLAGALKVSEFVNADTIARGLSAFHPEAVALEAGRIMLDRLRGLAVTRESFAFETTLAGRTFAPWIAELRRSGYFFYLIYLSLPSAELAIARVRDRVRKGGHHVPDETVRRRFQGGLRNFFTLYRPIADEWCFYDSSRPSAPRLVAMGDCRGQEAADDMNEWKEIQKGAIDVPGR
ncbi:MAG: zeta toxin [Gemmataceae bacterium]|nr:zeta toxin [Gemmataceae bacterium]